MDHSIHGGCAAAQAIKVLQITAMDRCASRD
jgi:hypothetical protein